MSLPPDCNPMLNDLGKKCVYFHLNWDPLCLLNWKTPPHHHHHPPVQGKRESILSDPGLYITLPFGCWMYIFLNTASRALFLHGKIMSRVKKAESVLLCMCCETRLLSGDFVYMKDGGNILPFFLLLFFFVPVKHALFLFFLSDVSRAVSPCGPLLFSYALFTFLA